MFSCWCVHYVYTATSGLQHKRMYTAMRLDASGSLVDMPLVIGMHSGPTRVQICDHRDGTGG